MKMIGGFVPARWFGVVVLVVGLLSGSQAFARVQLHVCRARAKAKKPVRASLQPKVLASRELRRRAKAKWRP